METLLVASDHRNQGYSRNNGQICSSPSRGFKDINCRTFQTSSGILPSPSFSKFSTFPIHKEVKSPRCYSEPPKPTKRSNPIAITAPKQSNKQSHRKATLNDEVARSELWAGPAYSNSPPPSSLPMPKFSLRQKRSVSLDLPVTKAVMDCQLVAKSAPSSPKREWSPPLSDDVFGSALSATENLRRILHLDD